MRSPEKPSPQASNQPTDSPIDRPTDLPPKPREIYAPQTERSPEAGTSPLMWAWLLFTLLLAGLVAWGWVEYLQSLQSSASEAVPAPSKLDLPTLPTIEPVEPPVAPSETDPETQLDPTNPVSDGTSL